MAPDAKSDLPPLHQACPFEPTLGLLGQRHALALLRALALRSPMRFNELQQALGITPKTLNARLREFIAHGLVDRKAHAEIPPRVEYALTPKGAGLKPLLVVLEEWHAENAAERGTHAATSPWRRG